MEKLKWKTDTRTVDELTPQSSNPRRITDTEVKKLTASLQKYDLVEIPVVDTDGTIIAGHQRVKILKKLGRGEEEIDVRVPSRKLTEKEKREYMIASNKLGGEWDFKKLKNFNFSTLDFSGFDDSEISQIFDDDNAVEPDRFDPSKYSKDKEGITTKRGDIIILGEHRILCGDATNPDNLKRLFAEDKAAMIYSDPVYNIDIDYDGGIGGESKYGGNVNDSRSLEEYREFLQQSLDAALSVTNQSAHIFYWCDQIYIGILQELYRNAGIKNKRVCLWLKNNQNPVPDVAFNKVYEPVVYGTRGNPYLANRTTNLNEVMNQSAGTGNQLLDDVDSYTDVWSEKRLPANEYTHATQKPPSLHEKAIKRCTKRGDIILDSFLGSGSTLMAAESLDRRVYGLDLEPKFCDLIIDRFEDKTGKAVTIESA